MPRPGFVQSMRIWQGVLQYSARTTPSARPKSRSARASSFMSTPAAICSMRSTWSCDSTGSPWLAAHSAKALVAAPKGLPVFSLMGPPSAKSDSSASGPSRMRVCAARPIR